MEKKQQHGASPDTLMFSRDTKTRLAELSDETETGHPYGLVCLVQLQSKSRLRLLLSACWPNRARIPGLSAKRDSSLPFVISS